MQIKHKISIIRLMPNLLENLIIGASIFGASTGVIAAESGAEHVLRSVNSVSPQEALLGRDFSTPPRPDISLNLIEHIFRPEARDAAAALSIIIGAGEVLVSIGGVVYVLSKRNQRYTDQHLRGVVAAGNDY